MAWQGDEEPEEGGKKDKIGGYSEESSVLGSDKED
jgi:hypothetical protein